MDMQSSQFGVHEVTDMREMINFKVACLAETKTRLQTVENPELKALVEQSITQGTNTIKQMRTLISSAKTQITE